MLAVTYASSQFVTYAQAQTTVTLSPTKDNTLYQRSNTQLSNGAGVYIFAGRTGSRASGRIHRAVIAFDIAGSVPAEATVGSVNLTMRVSRTAPGSGTETYTLQKLLADWGEGTSNAGAPGGDGTAPTTGDATWLHMLFDTQQWTTPGGDFEGTVSGSTPVGSNGSYTWTSPGMVADVQAWLDNPSSNFGWILRGNESETQNAKRFDSRESNTEANRPVLEISYSVAAPTATPAPPTPTPAATATPAPPTATPTPAPPTATSVPFTPVPIPPTVTPRPPTATPTAPDTGDARPPGNSVMALATLGAAFMVGGSVLLGRRRRQ